MPTYDYECIKCGHRQEEFVLHPDNAPDTVRCTRCDLPVAQRQISMGAGVIFRGPGFYETDYKRKKRGCRR